MFPWAPDASLALGVVLMGLLFQGFALVPLARRLGLTTTSSGAPRPLTP